MEQHNKRIIRESNKKGICCCWILPGAEICCTCELLEIVKESMEKANTKIVLDPKIIQAHGKTAVLVGIQEKIAVLEERCILC